jgi:hypothetical protein
MAKHMTAADVENVIYLREQRRLKWREIAKETGFSTTRLCANYFKARPRADKQQRTRFPSIETGARFGRLTVIRRMPYEVKAADCKYECKCDCGNLHYVLRGNLVRTKSCGCLHLELIRTRKPNLKHGMTDTPEWNSWAAMRARCSPNSEERKRKYYFDRGIRVCERWLGPQGFQNFFADMGPKPSPEHSLDRIDPNGNYEPCNCRWGTDIMQRWNQRHVIEECFEEDSTIQPETCYLGGGDDSV